MKNLTKRIVTMAAAIVLGGQLLAEVPKVSNVRASQRDGTKLVDILYDVEDAENDKLTIRIEISSDGGERYIVPAQTFEGAHGSNVIPGKDKKIIWNAGRDWDGEFSDKMRIRITASDGKGLPGLEWSKEIPPGGFLMGQDGGVEGSGSNIHLNVPYSYWITKYKITNAQYCEFLNLAYAAGKVDKRGKLLGFKTFQDSPSHWSAGLGDGEAIRWNINKFELLRMGDHAVRVQWYGAKAFAEFYGYDLPTEIEWEKAARGFNDDAGEHLLFQWGNDNDTRKYSNSKPVGWFNGINTAFDIVNDYGIYDLTGQEEWTRSRNSSLESLPKVVKKPNANLNFGRTANNLVYRGFATIYKRYNTSYNSSFTFRLVRRDSGK